MLAGEFKWKAATMKGGKSTICFQSSSKIETNEGLTIGLTLFLWV
jgi:hypothetical protein